MFQNISIRVLRGIYKCRISYLTSLHARAVSSLVTKSNRPAAAAFQSLHPQRCEQRRSFWGIDVAFNKVDEERVRLAGPDRAAAEWVLKNGGSIKWTTSANKLANYNLLPSTDFQSYKLQEIDLTATDVIDLGFQHLQDLKHLRKITLHGCRTIGDDALGHLRYVQDTLEDLNISRCPMITEQGLNLLAEFKKLKKLVIYDLIEVKNLETAVDSLKKSLPWCHIDTTDQLLSKTANDEH